MSGQHGRRRVEGGIGRPTADGLPPLNALRAFEAAARLSSFQKAARELRVTPAALSYQIKNLERHAGMPLFQRLNRAVNLTEAGRALQPGVADGFAALRMAWARVRRVAEGNALSLTAPPDFTERWLGPRLYRFVARHEGVELRFVASLRDLDLERDGIDVAIRIQAAPAPDLHAEVLAAEWVTPMMTPELAARVAGDPALPGVTLIDDESLAPGDPGAGWRRWFGLHGLPARGNGLRLTSGSLVLDAALAGRGAVLGRGLLAERELAAGRLVAPFRRALRLEEGCRLVCLPGTETRPVVVRFRDWMREELAGHAALGAGFEMLPLAAPTASA
ncbi:MAG: LysR family transcriptional regulator [Alphaproteobacteria bacterium]|nr:MAG: LysR family transcriptional regulator [Alphaproteobacteria bacterium]